MSHSNKVHSQGNVPFSWENQPGISKVIYKEECPKDEDDQQQHGFKLPLPPCPSDSPKVLGQVVDLQIPLPPCPFQPHMTRSSSSSRKGLRRHNNQEDPFLAAYKECTKSSKSANRQSNLSKNSKKGGDDHHESRGIGKSTSFMFSCKKSCGVKEDNLIRLSHQVSPPVVRESYYWREDGRKGMLE
ncbi:hypothetical protein BVC80_8887g5 [Macleaya cordata]|uniref:Uncharacterized protein n=1 Tax=Macleaya cordata TaxID=56857 RepID=A0A200PSL2_MACCD|nr:hypothetical protein BVC80_8887g5 [Macleaya cordata]